MQRAYHHSARWSEPSGIIEVYLEEKVIDAVGDLHNEQRYTD